MVNILKLHTELKAAGIQICGVASDGRINFTEAATQEQKDAASVILANHNPVWYVEERQKLYPSVGDQLDMIYWDAVNGTTIWKDTITGIKAAVPKE